MLASAETIRVVADKLTRHQVATVVLDPVRNDCTLHLHCLWANGLFIMIFKLLEVYWCYDGDGALLMR